MLNFLQQVWEKEAESDLGTRSYSIFCFSLWIQKINKTIIGQWKKTLKDFHSVLPHSHLASKIWIFLHIFLQRQGACLVLTVLSRLQSVPFSLTSLSGMRPQTTLVWAWRTPLKSMEEFGVPLETNQLLALLGSNHRISVFSSSSETPQLLSFSVIEALAELCRGVFPPTIIQFSEVFNF